MAKRKIQKFAALVLSAAMVFTSAPRAVYADSADTEMAETITTNTGSSNSDSNGADVEDTESSSSSESTSSTSEEKEIDGLTIYTVSDLTYTGKAQKLLDRIDGTQADDTVEYRINDGKYSTDEPEATNAGEYTIGIRIKRSGYKEFTQDVTVSIAKADMRIVNTPYELDYSGSKQNLMQEPEVKSAPSNVVFHYSVNGGAESTDLPKATDAGSYHIHITADGGKNYNDYEADLDAKINAVSISGLSAVLYGGTYDGKDHNAVASIRLKDGTDLLTSNTDYVVRYTMNGQDYGTTMPTVRNAGTYSIGISVENDPNFIKTDIASESLTPAEVVISKAKPELSWNSSIPNGDRITLGGQSKTLDFHAIRSNATTFDDYSPITYTVSNDSINDKTDIDGLASMSSDGKLTLMKAGCNLLVTAACKGDQNHEDAETILYGVTVAEERADALLHFSDTTKSFAIGTSNVVSVEKAEKIEDDNGTITYSMDAAESAPEMAGLSLDEKTGKITVANEKKLIQAAENHDGSLTYTITATKTAGNKTAGWNGWEEKSRTVYDKAEASYTLTLKLDTSLSDTDVTLQDGSGNILTKPNGDNGWYNTEVVVKPASGYQIAKDDLDFQNQVSFGADGENQGDDLSYGIYLKNVATGAVSRRITLSKISKLDSVAPSVDSISLNVPKQKKGTLWFFNRSDKKATVTITGSDKTSGVDLFQWVYTRSADASSSNERTLSGSVAAKLQSDGTYQATFVLPDDAKEDLKNGQLRGTLSVTALDKAGLKRGKTDDGRTIVVDSISPTMETKITPESENTSVNKQEGVYYSAGNTTVTFSVTEANFDPDDVEIHVTKDKAAYASNASWTDAIDGDTHEYALPLTEEGDYHIAVSYTDASGNQMQNAAYDIHIDKTVPVAAITYLNQDVKDTVTENGKKRNYFNSDQTARVVITEHNFDPAKVSFDIQADGKKADDSLYEIGAWQNDGDTHTADVVFPGDANYSFNVAVSDCAGNAMKARDEDLFTVDKTVPEGQLTIARNSSGFTSFVKKLIYKIFNIDSIEVKGTSTDKTAGIRSVDSYIYAPDEKGEFDGLSEEQLKTLDASNWKPFTGSVTVDPDAAAFVYLRITDRSGNTAYINTAEGAIADRTAPTVAISLDQNKDAANGTDVPFTITAKDPTSGKTYSGLQSISWKVLCDGKETQSGNTKDGMEIGSRVQSKTVSDLVSAKKNNSNRVVISAEAMDWAGNTTTVTQGLSVDTTRPEITLSYDNNDVRNGRYFNAARNLTVKVKERNFDEKTLVFLVTVDGKSYDISIADLKDGKYEDQDITLVSGPDDSEKEKENEERTDERTNVYVIRFGGNEGSDHDYTVSASETDTAGNSSTVFFADGTKAGDSFTVDMVKPVIKVAFNRDLVASTNEKTPAYSREDVQPEILVTERNFAADGTSMTVTQKNFYGTTLSVYDDQDRVYQKENWKSNDKENRYLPSVFTKDANYSLAFTYTDLAGNTAEPYAEHYFTIDKTAPEGTLKYETDETVFRQLIDRIRYWIYGTHSIGVLGSAKDLTSGVAKLEYLIYHPANTDAKGTFDSKMTESVLDQSEGWKPFTGRVTVDPDSSGFVYLRMTDQAGNRSYINTGNGAVADRTAPNDISIQLDETPAYGEIYNKDVPFTVTVTDPAKNDSYSGLKEVRWSVLANGKVTQSGTFDDGLTQSAKVQTQTGKAVINAAKNNSNNVVLRIETEDWAGNTASKEKDLLIDVTNPKVVLSYDNNSAQNQKYFKNDRTLTVSINERNFDEDDFYFPMTVDGAEHKVTFADIRDEKYSLSMVDDAKDTETEVTGRFLDDQRTITYKIGFGKKADADHDYKVAMAGCDASGNQAEISFADGSVAPSEFTIDKVAPIIRVSAESDGRSLAMTTDPDNPAFTQHFVTVTEVVEERNFDAKDASYTITQKNAKKQDVSVYQPIDITKNNVWKKNGTENTFTANVFSEDANYSASFAYTDLAGNAAVPYETHYFTVDKTAPTGTLTVDGDETAFHKLVQKIRYWIFGNTSIGISGTSDDETAGVAKTEYLIYHPTPDESAKGILDSTMTEAVLDQETGWKPFSGKVSISPDNSGFVYLKVTDRAGNRSYINTSDGVISEQTNPDNISIQLDRQPKGGNVYNTDVPFTVKVSDVMNGDTYSGLKEVHWSVFADGKITQTGSFDEGLEKGARIQSQTGKAVINAEKSNSNNVVLRVNAEDWAGNTASSEVKLSIDVTRPEVILTYDNNNAKNQKYFKEDRDLTVTINERNFEEEDFFLPMTIDGEKKDVSLADIRDGKYSLTMIADRQDTEAKVEQRLLDDARTITYKIGFGKESAADHDYQVAMKGQDTAGNVADVSFAEGSVAPSDFTIDKVVPVIRISAESDGEDLAMTTDPTNPAFTQHATTVTAMVEERNFDAKDAAYVVTQKNAKGKNLTVYPVADITDGSLWKSSRETNTFQANVFTEDANYSVAFTYTDLAGNEAVPYETHYFTVDQTAPTGTLTVDGDETIFDKLVQKIRYWIFRNKSTDISGTSDDETSGVSQVEYWIYHPEPDENAKGTFDSHVTESVLDRQTGWKPFTGKMSIDPDRSGFVYLKVTDRAGNRAYINTADGVISETTKPDDITITLDHQPTRGTVYSGDVPFTVKVSDVKNGDTYSGLKEIHWTVLKDGQETQSGTFNDGLERGARVRSQIGHATVEAKKNNSNNVVIRVDVTDWAGNTVTKEQELSVDITNPEVTLSYDNNSAKNQKYFKDDRNMTVRIRERNFEEGDFSFPMTIDGVKRTVSLSDIRSGNYSLTMVRDLSDSESGVAAKNYTDDRTISYVVGFGKSVDADHDYQVDMDGQDTAGNKAKVAFASDSIAASEFTIDKVAPVIRVTAESAGNSLAPTISVESPAFTQHPVEITELVEERNFDAKDASYQVTQKNAAGNDLSVYASSDIHIGNLWSRNENMNTFHPNTFSQDANYSISFAYTDLAGNTATPYEAHYFTVDKTAPTGSLTTGTKGSTETFTSLIDHLRFLFHDRNAITVTGSSSDDIAGIASVRYLVYDPGVNARNTFTGLTAAQLESMNGWADWNGSIRISPDRQGIVYLRMEDRAGNVAFVNTADGIVADDNSPSSIQIELLGTPSAQGIYNSNVPFRITASDPERGGTYSGLRHVNWEIRSNGRVTQSGNFDSMAGDVTARTQTITGNGTIMAAQNNSNHVVLHVTTEDWAGNTAQAEKELAIDITKPSIEITYDRNDPKNGKYYNAVRTATVRVVERNFDPSKVSLHLTSTNGTPQVSGWSVSPQKGLSDNAVNTATIVFPGDADYTVTASCVDMAGNRSDYSRVDTFTVDRTAPEIQVTYDNNDVKNNHYYKKGRTATITVKEHNFNASAFQAAVKAAYAGSEKKAPAISSFTTNGDNHTASIRFAEDGDYSFNLQNTDLAGNVSKVFTQSLFTIDTTAPELSFFDIADKSANRGTVAPGAEYSDINYDKNGVTFTLTGIRHKEKKVNGTYTATAKGGRTKMADFAHKMDVDDIYTLKGFVTDLAGNVTEKEVQFSVNRFGSNYTFDKTTEKFLDAYYAKKGKNLTITETNTDLLKTKGVRISKDGVVRTLKEGSDYTVEETGGNGSWKQYTYIIKASCFRKEGIYEIILDSEDAAGNRQDNKLKDHPIRFVIDATAPDVVVTGIENKGRYREIERTADIVVNDVSPIEEVTIKMNGEIVKTFRRAAIEKADGKLSYTIKAADGWQNVSVLAKDAAGNVSDAQKYRVLVTTNWWQQTIYAPWFIPVIVIIAAAIGFLIFLWLWKGRKKEDGKTPSADS